MAQRKSFSDTRVEDVVLPALEPDTRARPQGSDTTRLAPEEVFDADEEINAAQTLLSSYNEEKSSVESQIAAPTTDRPKPIPAIVIVREW
jgi:hypothetical protein